VSRFIEHVVWLQAESLVNPADVRALCRAIRLRVAEVFSKLPVQSAGQAGDLLCLLAEHAPACPTLDANSPRRALEARLSCLVRRPGGTEGGGGDGADIEMLARCHAEVAALVQRGVISPNVGNIVTGHVTRWIEQAPLAAIYRNAAMVRSLAVALPELLLLLSGRMQRLALQRFDSGRLLGYVLVLLDFRESGLALLDAPLEDNLVQQLCAGIERWPIERLTTELGDEGALRLICQVSESVREAVRGTLLRRVLAGPTEIIKSLHSDADYPRVRAELTAWARLVRVSGSAGLLTLDSQQRRDIVNLLSDCTSRCMASKELRPHVEELEKAQWSVVVLTVGASS